MAAKPTSGHSARCHPGNADSASDGRLFSPVFERNAPPLIAALTPRLGKSRGTVLEIGAGSGQHAGAFQLAFPELDWVASDPYPSHRASVEAWRARLRLPAREPLALDAAADWHEDPGVRALGKLTAVVSLNVIHIAPFAVAEGIVAGAGKVLAEGGQLIFYGPFKVDGAHIGSGNEAFDAGLRADNLDWGVRDVGEVEALATIAGLTIAAVKPMPANNRLLVFRRT